MSAISPLCHPDILSIKYQLEKTSNQKLYILEEEIGKILKL